MDGFSILDERLWRPELYTETPEYKAGNAFGWLYRGNKQAATNYPLVGRLYVAKSGWLLLSVPNALVRGVFDAMAVPGAELPLAGVMNVPNVDADVLNAHISVMTADEVNKVGVDNINERGHMFSYRLGSMKEINVKNVDGVSKVWIIQVSSPELAALRKTYGLSPLPRGDHPFHITVAARRKKVLQENGVRKAAAADTVNYECGCSGRCMCPDNCVCKQSGYCCGTEKAAAANLIKLAPKWGEREHILAALPKHLSDTQAAINTGDNVDKEMTDLALIANAWLKSQQQKELLAARLKKFKETAAYPSLAAQKTAEELPWRDRVEIFTKHPRTGKIYGGVWDNDNSFAAPGGGIDPGETPEQAAVRELAEETGIQAANPVLLPIPPVKNPWSDEYRARTGRNFAGSRTHFVLADFVNKQKNKNLDFWAANNRKFYRPEQALELMQNKTLPSVGEARMQALQHIIERANKTAAADPEKSILVSGHSGAGKSTLAKALAEKLKLPLHSADKHPDFSAFFADKTRVPGAETVPGTPEYAAFQTLRKRVGEETLANATGPVVIEGIQLAALPPEQLQQYKHRIYVQTPIKQLLQQRFERQKNRAASKGQPWNEDELKSKFQLGRKIYDAQKDVMDNYATLPGTLKYRTYKDDVDALLARLKAAAATELSRSGQKDLLPGGKADNLPDREFTPAELAEGTKHEHEHTSNDQVAKEIAKDHLQEDAAYYEKVKQIEKTSLGHPNILQELRAAKEHSDNKRYEYKTQILRRLMSQSPQDWIIDDPKPRHKGVTHVPTKFKFHADPTAIPDGVKVAANVYLDQLRNMYSLQRPIVYDYNKPVFENIRDQAMEVKRRGDFMINARQNHQRYMSALSPKYRYELAMKAMRGEMEQPTFAEQTIHNYGDHFLNMALGAPK